MISIVAASWLTRPNKFWGRGRELKELGVLRQRTQGPNTGCRRAAYLTVEGLSFLQIKNIFVMCHSYIG